MLFLSLVLNGEPVFVYIRAADLGGLCFSNIFSDGSLLSRGKKPSNGSLARAKGGMGLLA